MRPLMIVQHHPVFTKINQQDNTYNVSKQLRINRIENNTHEHMERNIKSQSSVSWAAARNSGNMVTLFCDAKHPFPSTTMFLDGQIAQFLWTAVKCDSSLHSLTRERERFGTPSSSWWRNVNWCRDEGGRMFFNECSWPRLWTSQWFQFLWEENYSTSLIWYAHKLDYFQNLV